MKYDTKAVETVRRTLELAYEQQDVWIATPDTGSCLIYDGGVWQYRNGVVDRWYSCFDGLLVDARQPEGLERFGLLLLDGSARKSIATNSVRVFCKWFLSGNARRKMERIQSLLAPDPDIRPAPVEYLHDAILPARTLLEFDALLLPMLEGLHSPREKLAEQAGLLDVRDDTQLMIFIPACEQ